MSFERDLLAILPTYLSVFFPGAQALTVIRMLRFLRVFRILPDDLVCRCCAETLQRSVCPSCLYATGWHECQSDARKHFLWRKGTLHAGSLDVQRCLFNLHRKLAPTTVLQEKAAHTLLSAHCGLSSRKEGMPPY